MDGALPEQPVPVPETEAEARDRREGPNYREGRGRLSSIDLLPDEAGDGQDDC